jgi:recombination protein RecT
MAQGTRLTPVEHKSSVRDLLKRAEANITKLCPKHLTPERMLDLAMVGYSKTPGILNCSPASILSCVIKATELGLDLSGTLGQAYMVPFKNKKTGHTEATFIIGYQGLIDLALRSGHVVHIDADNVFEGDVFEYEYGTSKYLRHVPSFDPAHTKDLWLYTYSVAYLKGSHSTFRVLRKDFVEGIEKRSRATTGPWKTDFFQMTRKTAVRQVCKYLPMSPEMYAALAHEDAVDSGEVVRSVQATVHGSKSDQLADDLLGGAAAEPPPDAEPEEEPDPEWFGEWKALVPKLGPEKLKQVMELAGEDVVTPDLGIDAGAFLVEAAQAALSK